MLPYKGYNRGTMARMFPPECAAISPADTGSMGEQLVYDALSKLPDDWTVLHNCWRHVFVKEQKAENRKHVSYEADFIVLVPGCGVLVLEVKNWYRAKVEDGRWYRWIKGGEYAPAEHGSPLNQAFLAMKYLRSELSKRWAWGRDGRSRLECRCMAVVLGEIVRPAAEAMPPADEEAVESQARGCGFEDVPHNEVYDLLYLCGTPALEDGLQQRIEKLFCYKNYTTAEELEEVRRYLLQNLVMRTDAATATAIVNTAAAPLTRILPLLEESPGGVHVEGCAGSGKSVMLCMEAARLAMQAQNQRVLVLCFNFNLAEYLRVEAAMQVAGVARFDTESPLVLDNFETVVKRICEREQLPLPQLFTASDDSLQPLSECIRKNPQYAFQHIFVDEAQDFLPEWWLVVQAMLGPGGKLYVFSDAGQSIYGSQSALPEFPVRLRLKDNLRNTSQIAGFCSALCTGIQHSLPLQGPGVQVYPPLETYAERALAVKETILQLLKEGFALNDIVVLSPWRKNNSLKDPLLAELVDFPADGETRNNAHERLMRCLAPGATRVLGETVKAYKGLESPAVILTDISAPKDTPNSGFTTNELYVACTRARFRLIIIPTPSGAEFLQTLG